MAKTVPSTARAKSGAARGTQHEPLSAAQRARQSPAAPSSAPDEDSEAPAYPKVFYAKRKPSVKYPNGYEARRVYDDVEEGRLSAEWKDTPEGMSPDVPFGDRG